MLRQRITELTQWHNRSLQLAIACGIGLLFGVASLWFSPLRVLAGLAAICFLVVTLRRPELGLLAILVMTSSIIFEDRLPLIPMGIGSLNLPDVPLLMLIALIIVRSLAEPEFKLVRTPLDLPLLVFLGMILLSTLITVQRGSVSTEQALRGMRTITYYLTFFIVTNLVCRKDQIALLMNGLILLATIVAGAMVMQSLLGTSLTLFPGRVETLVTQGSTYAGVTRVLPPGQSLVMFGSILVVVSLVVDHSRSLSIVRFLLAGLLGLAVVLTFNRNFWIMGSLALFILACLVRGRDRQKLLGWSVLAVLLGIVVLGLVLAQSEPRTERLVQGALARFGTLADEDTPQEDSLQYRYVENSYALPNIASHPVVGLGLRARYRPWDQRLDGSEFKPRPTSFDMRTKIHNGHLWVLLTSGWVGYLGLVWLSVAFLLRGFKNWRNIPDVKMRAIMLACVLTYVGVIVAAIVNPIYEQWHWIPLLGIMMGSSETILRLRQEGALD